VKESRTYLLQPDFSLRLLSLGGGRHGTVSAAYWLQSQDQVTDDYATRIWSDLEPEREPWVLVTVLFDRAYDPLSLDLMRLYPELRQVVARGLGGGD
jgi:hypothetical protein